MRINGQYVVSPTLTELLQQVSDDVNAKLRVEMTGTIISYNASTRTASVELGEVFVLNDGTLMPVPAPIPDVPVFTIQGGGIHIGMPILPGDECLLIFCDFNIGNWFTSGGQQVPPDQRQHDISDAFAFVGVNSLANPLLTSLDALEGGLASATSKVAINSATELITIANGPLPANNLNGILQVLLAAIAASSVLDAPTKAAATTAATQLSGLLY